MESINQFNKGLNKDINPLSNPKGSYIDAQNIRLINDAETTSLSLNNILGNDFKLTIPDSPLIQKISINSQAAAQNITISAQTGLGFSTSGATGEDVYNYIINDPAYTLCAQNVGASSPTYNIYYNSNYIIVIPIVFSVTLWITVTAALTLNNSYIPAQTGLEVIGSTTIRDDIYLFTTNNTTKNPGGHAFDSSLPTDPSSIGVIWKLEYDKVTLVSTITLIYANYLDFSTYWCIAPSACLGRYENGSIQRLYWTDNFNKLRSLNVKDSQALALDISILDILPAVDFDIPLLQQLQSNGTTNGKVGVIQCAYRLKNTGGNITTFSELSNVVTLVNRDEANTNVWSNYIGSNIGQTLSKQIVWKIDNIDRDFDRIEACIVFRDSLTGSPVIELLDDAPITSDSYTVIYEGTQTNTTPVTLIEFLAMSGIFTHCKTIDTKDNRLFAANTRSQFSELNYDARAYRFPTGSTTLTITENGSPTVYPTATWSTTGSTVPFGWGTIPENSDAINANLPVNRFKRNSTVLGGTGQNISYEFYTTALSADNERALGLDFEVQYLQGSPWRDTRPRIEQTEINLNVYSPNNQGGLTLQEYPNNLPVKINDGFKYPQYNGLLKGYQRNEIYRFGILFKDKQGNPFFVKWIGDIQMPDYTDSNPNSYYEDGTSTGITDFRPSFVANKTGAYQEAWVQSLGIRFEVYIPDNIQELIGGYEIVRVDRTEADKTIVCEGYNNKIDQSSGLASDNFWMTALFFDQSGNTQYGPTNYDRGFFVTPNICDGTLTPPSTNMTFTVRGIMETANATTTMSTGGADPYSYYKLYNWSPTTVTTYDIEQITELGFAAQGTDFLTGKDVYNFDFDTNASNTNDSYSLGNRAYYYRLSNVMDFTGINSSGNRFLISVEQVLTNQYGGNTYSSRANNIYQSCSHFQPIRTSQLGVPNIFSVYGGDVFVNMYDSCRWTKNAGILRGNPANQYSTTMFFPVSSPVNTDLRNGVYMNKDFAGGLGYEVPDFEETYTYNTIYSANNNIKQYFPKPDPFILNEEFDTRFHASEIKINGELTDNWGVFLPNNYWDTEGSYGPINAITAMGAEMYFWQDRAFGTMSINPRVMVTDTGTDAQIQLGIGSVLQRHDYISIEVGLQHQWGMTKSSQKLYWMDINKKKFFDYSKGQLVPESDVKGMLSWFNTYLKNNINKLDKPVYNDPSLGLNGIRSVYDYKYNQAIFTFSDASNIEDQVNYTLIFDDFINAFSSFVSYTPKVYITDFNRIFSTDPSNLLDIYMHDSGNYCEFYGSVQDSSVKLVVNDNYQYTKIFDNIMYDSQSLVYSPTYNNYQNQFSDTWNEIRVYNDYQNTDFQPLNIGSSLERKERTWQLFIPRNRVTYTGSQSPNIFNPAELSSPNNKSFGERMRDKYIVIDLKYNNSSNRLLTCNNFRTLYRISAR